MRYIRRDMATTDLVILAAAFFGVAALYSSVGHAGASGYLAAMALLGVAPATMRPVALVLNILVASLTVYRFSRAGFFNWRNLWPFLLGSVPLAALGGAANLVSRQYYVIVGAALLISAAIIFWRASGRGDRIMASGSRLIPVLPAVLIGAGVGVLSGLTGTGGGIFLSPVVLLAGWAGPKETSGISAPFILANSTAALLAGSFTWATIPDELPLLASAALGGALVGTWLGVKRLPIQGLLVALGVVLIIAAAKLFLTR
jgi:uncharacterized protein